MEATIADVDVGGKLATGAPLMTFLRQLADVARFGFAILRAALRLDLPIAIFAVIYLVLFAPLIPRNADNPQLLAAYSNDEPFLAMALEAMLVSPYGNPGAYFDTSNPASGEIPEHWADMRYSNIVYYGGAMFELAFPPYAVLRAGGISPFPAGPIVLRTLTVLAGLLSLLVLYNIAKERGSRLVGLLAAGWLASDAYFLYYANFIHPDTLQLLFGLLAFLAAVAHSREGDRTSLIALGILCGVVHGTKAGGVWTVPMALLAISLGARAGAGELSLRSARRVASRVLVYGVGALGGFFVTTPYAFVDGYYLRSLRLAYGAVTKNALQLEEISLVTWGEAFYEYIGRVAVILVIATVARAMWVNRRSVTDPALPLAVVLAGSQFLYFGGAGRLWHVPGYLLLGYAMMATFSFETVLAGTRALLAAAARALQLTLRVQKVAWGLVVLVVVAFLASSRWYVPAAWAVDQYLLTHSTVREANAWAIDRGVESDAVIVFDDLAYFDRGQFPRAKLNGGVLTWRTVDAVDPDYIVLSGSLWGAPWMQNLIAKQRLARRDPEPFNVSLYQDLLATKSPGPTSTRGIELEKVLRPAPVSSERSRLADLAGACDGVLVCDLGIVDLKAELALAGDLERRVRALLGAGRRPLAGPELRIFHVRR